MHLYPPELKAVAGAYLLKSLGFEKAYRRLPAKGTMRFNDSVESE